MTWYSWKLGRLAWSSYGDGVMNDADGEWRRLAGPVWWLLIRTPDPE